MTETTKRGRGRPPGSKNKTKRGRPKSVRVESRKREAKARPQKRPRPVSTEVQAEICLPGEGFGHSRKPSKEETDAEPNGQWSLLFPRPRGRPKGTSILKPDEVTLYKIWDVGLRQCARRDVAVALGVCEKTLARFFDEHPIAEQVFEDARHAGQGSLRAELFRQALDGNTPALLFSAKHYLGMNDKPREDEGKGGIPVDVIESAANEFERRILDLAAKRRRAVDAAEGG